MIKITLLKDYYKIYNIDNINGNIIKKLTTQTQNSLRTQK